MENKAKDSCFRIDDKDFQDISYFNIFSNQMHDTNESKIKNRMAAKKFREKKNAFLNRLEMENDCLIKEALRLSYKEISIKTENKILEENISFFQSFLYNIMNNK